MAIAKTSLSTKPQVERLEARLEVILLSARASIAFVEAILNPKGPNEDLLKAARRHRELFGQME